MSPTPAEMASAREWRLESIPHHCQLAPCAPCYENVLNLRILLEGGSVSQILSLSLLRSHFPEPSFPVL